jgi:hypothetical protein
MKRTSQIMLVLLAAAFSAASAHASLAEIGFVTSSSTEGGYTSGIIDTADNFIAFGSSVPFVFFGSTVSAVSEISISTFTYTGSNRAFDRLTSLNAGVFDPGTGFSFWASSGAPSALIQIHLAAPTSLSSTTFQPGENNIGTGVIDTAKHIAYFGTQTSPSIIVKVQLPDGVSVTSMTIVSSMTLPSGLDFLDASVIDSQNAFAYFGSSTTTGAVAKIKLADFTLAGTLNFNSGEGGVASAVIDNTSGFAYFGTHDSPGKVVKVQLTSFTRGSVMTLQGGENNLTSAVIDPAISLAFFGTNTSSGIVIPINLSNFSRGTALTLSHSFLQSAVIDTTNHFAYFGTYTTPGIVVKVDPLSGPPDILTQPANVIEHPGETATFAILAEGRGVTYQWQRNGINISGATSAAYTFAVAAADDGAAFHCVVTNANGSTTSIDVTVTIIPIVKVFPNPWRADRHTGLNLTFDGLLPNATLKIFSLSAHWIKTLPAGSNTWDLKNDAGQMVASGYYFFVATTGNSNQTSRGEIAIIR